MYRFCVRCTHSTGCRRLVRGISCSQTPHGHWEKDFSQLRSPSVIPMHTNTDRLHASTQRHTNTPHVIYKRHITPSQRFCYSDSRQFVVLVSPQKILTATDKAKDIPITVSLFIYSIQSIFSFKSQPMLDNVQALFFKSYCLLPQTLLTNPAIPLLPKNI